MRTAALLILFVLCTVHAFAQDTIFSRAQGKLLVRVLEIAQTEVRYKNFYNPDGIIRSIPSADIERIVYENGKTEARFGPAASLSYPGTLKPGKFVIEGRHLAYNNEDISYKAALKIMMQRDPHQNSDELNDALVTADGKKNGQITFTLLGPVCAVGGLYLARQNYYGPQDKNMAGTFILGGLGLCLGSGIIAQVYRKSKEKQVRRAATLYNQEP